MNIANIDAHGAINPAWQQLLTKKNEAGIMPEITSAEELREHFLRGFEGDKLTISEEARYLSQLHTLFLENGVTFNRQREAISPDNFYQPEDHPQRIFWDGNTFTVAESIRDEIRREQQHSTALFPLERMGHHENNRSQTEFVGNFMISFWETYIGHTQRDSDVAFDISRAARERTAHLSNMYAEMRQSLEANYSGEELEDRLRWLSQGFDIMAQEIARGVGDFVGHNLSRIRDARGMTGEQAAEFNRITENIVAAIEKTVFALAQATRQFVLENGSLDADGNIEKFEAFLQSAERPTGGFSLSNINIFEEMLRLHGTARTSDQLLSDLGRLFQTGLR